MSLATLSPRPRRQLPKLLPVIPGKHPQIGKAAGNGRLRHGNGLGFGVCFERLVHLSELLLPEVTHGAGVQMLLKGVLQGSRGNLGLGCQVVER